jgi:hypothetical protein
LTGIWHQLVVCNWRTFTIRHGEKSRRFVSSKKSFRREGTLEQEKKLPKKPVRNVLVEKGKVAHESKIDDRFRICFLSSWATIRDYILKALEDLSD